MFRFMVLIFMLVLVPSLAQSQSKDIGRYQVVSGEVFKCSVPTGCTREVSMIRIDTVTGKSWEYSFFDKEGRSPPVSYWSEIREEEEYFKLVEDMKKK